MATPSSSLATLRPELGASLLSFNLAMSQNGFIAQQVLPVLEVDKQAGPFGKIKIESLLQQRNTLRNSRGGYSRQDWEFTTDSYQTAEHGAEEKVDDRDKNLYGSYFIAEQMAAMRARDIVLRNYESRVAAAVTDTSVWTGSALTTAVTTPWSTTASATPIADVTGAKKKVYANSGLRPNTLIITYNKFLDLQQNADLIARIKYAGLQDPNTRGITYAALAQAFDVEQVLVAGAQYNSANEGQAAVLAPVWNDTYGMVCYVAKSQDIQEPSIGRTFHWGGDGSQMGGIMETYRDESVRANIVRCRQETQEKILLSICGHLLTNL